MKTNTKNSCQHLLFRWLLSMVFLHHSPFFILHFHWKDWFVYSHLSSSHYPFRSSDGGALNWSDGKSAFHPLSLGQESLQVECKCQRTKEYTLWLFDSDCSFLVFPAAAISSGALFSLSSLCWPTLLQFHTGAAFILNVVVPEQFVASIYSVCSDFLNRVYCDGVFFSCPKKRILYHFHSIHFNNEDFSITCLCFSCFFVYQ